MQCSCGSSSFLNSSLKHEIDARACMYSFSACKSCGRQGDNQLTDTLTGEVLAKGILAIQAVQRGELLPVAPKVDLKPYDLLASPTNDTFSFEARLAETITVTTSAVLNGMIDQAAPAKKPLTSHEKGKALHNRGRHYFFWNSQSHKVRVKYHHHVFDNGAEEACIPAFGLIDNRKAGEEVRSPLKSTLAHVKAVLERYFDEPTYSTGITCAPPQGDCLAVWKGGEWVSMLEHVEPTINTTECEVEDVVETNTPDMHVEKLEIGSAMDFDGSSDSGSAQEEEIDPLMVSPSQSLENKDPFQISLF